MVYPIPSNQSELVVTLWRYQIGIFPQLAGNVVCRDAAIFLALGVDRKWRCTLEMTGCTLSDIIGAICLAARPSVSSSDVLGWVLEIKEPRAAMRGHLLSVARFRRPLPALSIDGRPLWKPYSLLASDAG